MNNIPRFNYYLSWALVIVLILIYYAIAPGSYYIQNMFSSDVMYLPSLYKDIFHDGYQFTDWSFPGAPFFFPDMILYFILHFFLKSIALTLFIYAFCQFFMVLFLINRLIRQVCPHCNHNILALCNLLFSVFILITIIPQKINSFSYYLLTPVYHTGGFICTLIVMILLVKYLEKKQNKYLYLLIIISILAILSDKLFLLIFPIPFIGSILVVKRTNKDHGKRNLAVSVILSVIIGHVLLMLTRSLIFSTVPNIKPDYALFSSVIPKIFTFFRLYMKPFNLTSVIVIIGLLSYLGNIVFLLTYRHLSYQRKLFHVYYLFMFPLLLFAPFVTGLYVDRSCIRYIIFIFYFSMINLCFPLTYVMNIMKSKPVNLFLLAIFVVFISFALIKYKPGRIVVGVSGFLKFEPSYIKCLDETAEKEGLKYGISDYWYAKVAIMFSRNDLRVYSVYQSSLVPYSVVANRNWYYDTDYGKYNQPVYNFILMDKDYNYPIVLEIFGSVDTTIYCNDVVIFKTPEFTINRQNQIELIK